MDGLSVCCLFVLFVFPNCPFRRAISATSILTWIWCPGTQTFGTSQATLIQVTPGCIQQLWQCPPAPQGWAGSALWCPSFGTVGCLLNLSLWWEVRRCFCRMGAAGEGWPAGQAVKWLSSLKALCCALLQELNSWCNVFITDLPLLKARTVRLLCLSPADANVKTEPLSPAASSCSVPSPSSVDSPVQNVPVCRNLPVTQIAGVIQTQLWQTKSLLIYVSDQLCRIRGNSLFFHPLCKKLPFSNVFLTLLLRSIPKRAGSVLLPQLCACLPNKMPFKGFWVQQLLISAALHSADKEKVLLGFSVVLSIDQNKIEQNLSPVSCSINMSQFLVVIFICFGSVTSSIFCLQDDMDFSCSSQMSPISLYIKSSGSPASPEGDAGKKPAVSATSRSGRRDWVTSIPQLWIRQL